MDQNQAQQKQGRVSEIEGQLGDLKAKAATAEGDAKAEYEKQITALESEKSSLQNDLGEAESMAKGIGGDLKL